MNEPFATVMVKWTIVWLCAKEIEESAEANKRQLFETYLSVGSKSKSAVEVENGARY